jgi:hypothetical protein
MPLGIEQIQSNAATKLELSGVAEGVERPQERILWLCRANDAESRENRKSLMLHIVFKPI